MERLTLAFVIVTMIFQATNHIQVAMELWEIKQNQKEILFQIVNKD